MSLALIYNYIINPNQTLLVWHYKKPILECFFIVMLSCFAQLVDVYYLGIFQKLILFMLVFFISLVILLIQSVLLDFTAQIFKLKSQSLQLFCWLGVSWLPFLLAAPTKLIVLSSNSLSYLPILISICFLVLVIVLQIITVKWLYQTTTFSSILIYFIPSGMFFALSFIFILLGSAFIFTTFFL